MQASIFGNLGLKVTDSRTIDYYRGGLDQKQFQNIYCGCFCYSGSTFLCVQIACNKRSYLFVAFRYISGSFSSCIIVA